VHSRRQYVATDGVCGILEPAVAATRCSTLAIIWEFALVKWIDEDFTRRAPHQEEKAVCQRVRKLIQSFSVDAHKLTLPIQSPRIIPRVTILHPMNEATMAAKYKKSQRVPNGTGLAGSSQQTVVVNQDSSEQAGPR